jgi:hypothetical protein
MTFPNGIYFGLDFEEYRSIERLSKSGIKQLLISPADYWADSYLNPSPKRLTPQQQKTREMAKLLGQAYHCARLEPDQFHDRYVREISHADFANIEGFLVTGTDMGSQLEGMGEKKSGSVAEQAERLRLAGYAGPIWQIELAAWEANRGGRIALPAEAFDQIEIDMLRIAAVPSVHATLSDGFAEVSILYDCPDTGLPMKARLDWLRADGWVEFKSFANPNGKQLEQCLMDAIKYNRYYIDVAAYHEAVETIRTGENAICRGEFTAAHAVMIDDISQSPVPLPHRLIFQQKGGVPNVLSREIRLFESPYRAVEELRADNATDDRIAKAEKFAGELTPRPTMLMMKARAEIKRAKRAFIGYNEIYERGQPWQPFEPHREVSDLDFSPYFLETI